MTHTYAVLEVSAAAYDEIAGKLRAAGYGHAFGHNDRHGELINMQGIALGREKEEINEHRQSSGRSTLPKTRRG